VQFYAQTGQDLTSEEQARALVVTYRREKAFKRLLELTTDPDPDAETPVEEIEETAIANAEAAALTGELIEATEPPSADTTNTTDTEAKIGENEEPVVNSASLADEPIADVVE
jgi:trigger factor